jgi:hypothetical protein
MRVLGIDPAVTIAAEATTRGVETISRLFTSELAHGIRVERGPAWFVTANNVFAHADDLADMTEGVRELLAPDGIFVFEVSYLGDMVNRLLFDTVYHEHLSYHSLSPLSNFLSRHGLELFDVKRVASKGGSIQCWVQPIGGRWARGQSVDRLLQLESSMGLAEPETFRQFSQRIKKAKDQLHETIGSMRAARESVAGYGASATVTTLIYNLQLGECLGYLIDDDRRRTGLLSPGHHLAVMRPEALCEQQPKAVVVLAWQYAGPIITKRQSYLNRGGQFVIPLPRAQVITRLSELGSSV